MKVKDRIKDMGLTARELALNWGYLPQTFHAMSEEKFDYLLKIGGGYKYKEEVDELRRKAVDLYYSDYTARELFEMLPEGMFAQHESFRTCLDTVAFKGTADRDMNFPVFKKWKRIMEIFEEQGVI